MGGEVPLVFIQIAIALKDWGPKAVPVLEDLYNKSSDFDVRLKTLVSLGGIGDEKAIEILAKKASKKVETNSDLRMGAVSELGGFKKSEVALNALLNSYKEEPESNVRNEIIFRLGMIGSDKALDVLKEATKDTHLLVRESAKMALDKIQSKPKK